MNKLHHMGAFCAITWVLVKHLVKFITYADTGANATTHPSSGYALNIIAEILACMVLVTKALKSITASANTNCLI